MIEKLFALSAQNLKCSNMSAHAKSCTCKNILFDKQVCSDFLINYLLIENISHEILYNFFLFVFDFALNACSGPCCQKYRNFWNQLISSLL